MSHGSSVIRKPRWVGIRTVQPIQRAMAADPQKRRVRRSAPATRCAASTRGQRDRERGRRRARKAAATITSAQEYVQRSATCKACPHPTGGCPGISRTTLGVAMRMPINVQKTKNPPQKSQRLRPSHREAWSTPGLERRVSPVLSLIGTP